MANPHRANIPYPITKAVLLLFRTSLPRNTTSRITSFERSGPTAGQSTLGIARFPPFARSVDFHFAMHGSTMPRPDLQIDRATSRIVDSRKCYDFTRIFPCSEGSSISRARGGVLACCTAVFRWRILAVCTTHPRRPRTPTAEEARTSSLPIKADASARLQKTAAYCGLERGLRWPTRSRHN